MANGIARSEMERQARQFGRGTGRVKGNDALRAGNGGVLRRSEGLNGSFYVMTLGTSFRVRRGIHRVYLAPIPWVQTVCANI